MIRRLVFLFALAAMVTLLLGAAPVSQIGGSGSDANMTGAATVGRPGGGSGGGDDDDDDDDDDEIEFSVASIYFELNNTDGDLGIHALIDGEPWKHIDIEDPVERKKLRVTTRGTMRLQGLTELFFESAEPNFEELSPEEFFSRFAEGEWEVSGVTIEGDELESTTYLSHVMAAAPENIQVNGQPVPEDCDDGPVPSVAADMPIVITWDAVEDSHPEIGEPGDIEVELYQVVVGPDEEFPHLTADLSGDVTAYTLAPGLFSPGAEVKIEVLVRESTGNQTATESCFEIED